jgi:5'-deoxynucleotidase YfbR-like HD superfamily hydrolase
VAEHSFFVAAYTSWLMQALNYCFSDPSAGWQTLRFAIFHDVAEQFTSDLPGPVKRAVVDPDKLKVYESLGLRLRFDTLVPVVPPNEAAAAIVKTADLLDEMCYLLGEERLGNTNLRILKAASHQRLLHHWAVVMPRFFESGMLDYAWDTVIKRCMESEEHDQSKEPT